MVTILVFALLILAGVKFCRKSPGHGGPTVMNTVTNREDGGAQDMYVGGVGSGSVH
jgi:hypothetical protein